MKVLYIDSFCPTGHLNLNKKYIEEFNKLNAKIDFVLKENYWEALSINQNQVIWSVPNFFFKVHSKGFSSRFWMLLMLLQLRIKVNIKKYDYIFFSSYDEIVLVLSGIRHNLILVNHANIAAFQNPIKKFFLNLIPKNAWWIVFHQFIANRCIELGIKKITIQPFGMNKPYRNTESFYIQNLYKNFEMSIFIPSASKYGDTFFYDLLNNKSFLEYLKVNKIVIIIKDKSLKSTSPNIIILNKYLEGSEYESIFMNVDIILLHYPQTFEYRVSAILMECFANNKICLINKINAFSAFKENFNYNPYYSSPEELMALITQLKFNLTRGMILYKNLSNLEPDFISFFAKA